MRPFIERAAAYIAPIRIGGGTRLKIYEAMAMGKPVISTTVGAEVCLCAIILNCVGRHAGGVSAAIVRVLKDPALSRRLVTSVSATVRERFGWHGIAEQFAELCHGAASVRAAKIDEPVNVARKLAASQ